MPPRAASRSISPPRGIAGGCTSSTSSQHGGGHDHSHGGQHHSSARGGGACGEEASASLLEKGVGPADRGCGDSSLGGRRRREASEARRKLLLATFFCLAVMVCELVGGALSKSLAIMTDAAHMLTDVASFLVPRFALLPVAG